MFGQQLHEATHGANTTEARHPQHTHDATASHDQHEQREIAHTHGHTHHRNPSPHLQHHAHQPQHPIRTPAMHARVLGASQLAARTPTIGHEDAQPAEELSLILLADYSAPKRSAPTHHTAHRATHRAPRRHTRAQIHRRHLERVAYDQALKTYHVAYRSWRRALKDRINLLKKLIRLEHQLQIQKEHPNRHKTFTFEIDGIWYSVHGSSKRKELTETPR